MYGLFNQVSKKVRQYAQKTPNSQVINPLEIEFDNWFNKNISRHVGNVEKRQILRAFLMKSNVSTNDETALKNVDTTQWLTSFNNSKEDQQNIAELIKCLFDQLSRVRTVEKACISYPLICVACYFLDLSKLSTVVLLSFGMQITRLQSLYAEYSNTRKKCVELSRCLTKYPEIASVLEIASSSNSSILGLSSESRFAFFGNVRFPMNVMDTDAYQKIVETTLNYQTEFGEKVYDYVSNINLSITSSSSKLN